MASYNNGDRVSVQYTLRNNGTLYDPTASGRVAFTMREPDGTSTTYTWLAAGGGDAQISRLSVGLWEVVWTIDQTGGHNFKFQASTNTGTANSLEVTFGSFNVDTDPF